MGRPVVAGADETKDSGRVRHSGSPVRRRSLGWLRRFRGLAKNYERLPETVAGLHFLAFACLMLGRVIKLFAHSS